MTEPAKLDLRSMNITDDQKAKIKQLFPEVFNEDKVDFDKLKQTLGEDIDTGEERFGMTWPGKTDCFKVIQTPSIGTLKPAKEESVDWDTTENLFIEGDNLEVLKLLQRSYYSKIKMIYIDPPYNTGNDFVYPDDFSESLQTYLAYTGQKEGTQRFSSNTESGGRFHSKWLNMIYPRLFLAKNLLKNDGFIAVSISEEELNNLKTVMNEIFGEENHRNTLAVRRYDKNLSNQFIEKGLTSLAIGYEYVLIYSKETTSSLGPVFREASEDRQANGYWKGFWNAADRPTMRYDLFGFKPEEGQWKWKKETALEAVENYKIYMEQYSSDETLEEYWIRTGKSKKFIRHNPNGTGKNKGVDHWIPPSSGILRTSNWTDLLASESLGAIGIPFDNPKHTVLLENLIRLLTDENDIVLDFFAGSCSIAHSVLNLNISDSKSLNFICVQLPERIDPIDKNRQSDAFVFCKSINKPENLAEIGKERIRRVISKLSLESDDSSDLGFRVFKLDKSNFDIWDGTVEESKDVLGQIELFVDHLQPDSSQEEILFEILLKCGFKLTTKVEALELAGKSVYSIANKALLICLDKKLTKEVITEMARLQPARVVCLDTGFTNNDQLKTNAIQIMRSHNIEDFRTV